MGDGVRLVSSADETAKDVYRVLTEHNLLAPTDQEPNYSFFATGDASSFESLAKRFLGPEVTGVKRIERKK
jgi:glutamate racemase